MHWLETRRSASHDWGQVGQESFVAGGRSKREGGSRKTLMYKMTIHKHNLVLQVLGLGFDVDKYMCLSFLL